MSNKPSTRISPPIIEGWRKRNPFKLTLVEQKIVLDYIDYLLEEREYLRQKTVDRDREWAVIIIEVEALQKKLITIEAALERSVKTILELEERLYERTTSK